MNQQEINNSSFLYERILISTQYVYVLHFNFNTENSNSRPPPLPPFFEFPLLCFIGFFISILYRSRDTRFETKRDGARVEERRGQRGEGGGSVDEQKKGAVEGEREEGEGGGGGGALSTRARLIARAFGLVARN